MIEKTHGYPSLPALTRSLIWMLAFSRKMLPQPACAVPPPRARSHLPRQARQARGTAARVVHGGCRKALQRLVAVERVMKDEEGAAITVQPGFDPNRIRLTGNVTGQPPYKGVLKHHGWIASSLKFPALTETVDYRV